jgi:uncharacterized protein (TIGR03437 family)
LGGAEEDRALAVATDSADNVMVAGWTASRDFPFPRQGGGVQTAFGGGAGDMFFARLAPDSTGLAVAAQALQTSTSVLSFTSTMGSQRPPMAASLQITSAGSQPIVFTVEWSTSGSGTWLSAGPQRAETPATVNVFANPSGLAQGTHSGVVRLVPVSGGLPTLINVAFQILNPPAEIQSMSPSWVPAGSADFEVTLRGRGFAPGASVRLLAEDASGATTITPSVIQSNSLTFTVPRSLVFRDASFEIRVANPLAEISNPVSLIVGGRTGRVLVSSVSAAANGIAGPIAPGQMLLITGQGLGPAELVRAEVNNSILGNRAGGVRVLFDGVAAPLQFALDRQICVMAPYAIASAASVEVTVEYNGERSAPVALLVVPTQPGIFTADSFVWGYGLVTNDSGAENSSAAPARRGSIIGFVMTGAGLLNNGADGRLGLAGALANPLAPLSVTVDGRDAEIVMASEAPGDASGLVLMRVRVPPMSRTGELPLAVKSGDAVSPAVRLFVD